MFELHKPYYGSSANLINAVKFQREIVKQDKNNNSPLIDEDHVETYEPVLFGHASPEVQTLSVRDKVCIVARTIVHGLVISSEDSETLGAL